MAVAANALWNLPPVTPVMLQPFRTEDTIPLIGVFVVVSPAGVADVRRAVPGFLELSGFNRRIFDAIPHACVIFDRDLRIVEANPLYTKITMVERNRMLGRYVFDVFPENPNDPSADGKKVALESFSTVLTHKVLHHMPFQRYDIRDRSGYYVERYWKPTNCPVLDHDGKVEFILQSVEDMTGVMKRFRPLFTTPTP